MQHSCGYIAFPWGARTLIIYARLRDAHAICYSRCSAGEAGHQPKLFPLSGARKGPGCGNTQFLLGGERTRPCHVRGLVPLGGAGYAPGRKKYIILVGEREGATWPRKPTTASRRHRIIDRAAETVHLGPAARLVAEMYHFGWVAWGTRPDLGNRLF